MSKVKLSKTLRKLKSIDDLKNSLSYKSCEHGGEYKRFYLELEAACKRACQEIGYK